MITYINNNSYSNKEWYFAKIPFILVWLGLIIFVLYEFNYVKTEYGLCLFLNCNVINVTLVKYIFLFISVFFTLLYIIEKQMMLTTFVLSFISMFVFSAGNSNGIFYRSEILSCVLFAQFLAYTNYSLTKNKNQLYNNRFKFSVQLIASLYVLSAIKKLHTSGIYWILSYKEFALKAKTNILIIYANWGIDLTTYAELVYNTLYNNPIFTISILTISLLIEMLAFLMVVNKKATFIYGIVLLIFHLGIFITMFVYVPPILIVVITFVFNLPYILYLIFKKLNSIFFA